MEKQIINAEVSNEAFEPMMNRHIRIIVRDFFKADRPEGHKDALNKIFAMASSTAAFAKLDVDDRTLLSESFLDISDFIGEMGAINEDINK